MIYDVYKARVLTPYGRKTIQCLRPVGVEDYQQEQLNLLAERLSEREELILLEVFVDGKTYVSEAFHRNFNPEQVVFTESEERRWVALGEVLNP